MDKSMFQKLSLESQVHYINERMREGETLTNACLKIGITKEVSRKFQRKGYSLVDGQFIPSNQATEQQEVATDTISTTKPKSVKKVQETKKIGRPTRSFATTKLTLEINKDLIKTLKKHCVDIEKPMNKFIEELIRNNLK